MRSVLEVEVSCFKSYHSNEPKTVNLLTWLQSDKYVEEVKALREITDKAERDTIKASLPAITVSGIFDPTRKEEHLVKHSGLLCIDIDSKGNEHISNFDDLKKELFKIKNVVYAGLSVSGKGFFLIIPIAYPNRHKQHFKVLQRDLSAYGISIDSAPQNVASLRGYSFDPDALFRHHAIHYRKFLNKSHTASKNSIQKHFKFSKDYKTTKEKVEALVNHIVQNKIDITQNEPDWFRLACAFANEFGEAGRGYFHEISQFHSSYDRTQSDLKFDHALKEQYHSIGIGTFLKLAKNQLIL